MHLAKQIVAAGGKVGYIAEACVYHLHNESWQQIKRRFEREALALQYICPEVVVRKRDILRYFSRAIIKDICSSGKKAYSFWHIYKIILYRYFQYNGCLKGSQMQKNLSEQLKESYFYPTQSKGSPLTPK